MNIPESEDLTVRSWAEILFEFYSSTVSKLPAPKLTSPDGKYTYTMCLPRFIRQAKWGYTEAEEFCKESGFISASNFWKYNESFRKHYIVEFIAGLIRGYQEPNSNSLFPPELSLDPSSNMRLLLQNNIFEGISETNLNNWLGTYDSTISVAEAKILVENTKKFFSQYLA